jgi:hypothetical protein
MSGRGESPRLTSASATRGSLALACLRLAWGGLLVAAPGRVVRWLGGADTSTSRGVEGVLGVRHLLQGAVELRAWPAGRRLGVVVDGLHAASGVGLALVDGRWRRAALLDAAVTTGLAVAGAALR